MGTVAILFINICLISYGNIAAPGNCHHYTELPLLGRRAILKVGCQN